MKFHLQLDAKTRRAWLNYKELDPKVSQAVYNHSPDGFNWGYSGSGPAQLALAICIEMTNSENMALSYYQGLKEEVIAKLEQDKDFNGLLSYYF